MPTFSYLVFGTREFVARGHLASFKAFKAFHPRLEKTLDDIVEVLNLTDVIYHAGCSLTKFQRPDIKYDQMVAGKLRYINKEARIKLKALGINDVGVSFVGVPLKHDKLEQHHIDNIDQFAMDMIVKPNPGVVFAGIAKLELTGDTSYPVFESFYAISNEDGQTKYHPDNYVQPSIGNVFSFDETIDDVVTTRYYFVVSITKDIMKYREIYNFNHGDFCWSIARSSLTTHLVDIKPYVGWKKFSGSKWSNPQIYRA